jgi:hypothetical protein
MPLTFGRHRVLITRKVPDDKVSPGCFDVSFPLYDLENMTSRFRPQVFVRRRRRDEARIVIVRAGGF